LTKIVSKLLLHSPGTEHLQQNVCFEKYSEDHQDGYCADIPGRVFSDASSYDSEFPEVVIGAKKEILRSAAEDSKHKKIEDIGGDEIVDHEFDSEVLTIESCEPFFSVTRWVSLSIR